MTCHRVATATILCNRGGGIYEIYVNQKSQFFTIDAYVEWVHILCSGRVKGNLVGEEDLINESKT